MYETQPESLYIASLCIALGLIYVTTRGSGIDFSKIMKWWPGLFAVDIPSPPAKSALEAANAEPEESVSILANSSAQQFELEKRAVFSKTWLLLTHTSLFHKPGDYHTFTLSTYPILLILTKSNSIRAYHNVCRHRAYKVTKHSSGSSLVLTCRYHGWTYNADGKLIKAPQFDGLEGFKKEGNGLFEVALKVDEEGGVWVNLAEKEVVRGRPEMDGRGKAGWEKDSKWVGGWAVDVACDWKSIDIAKALETVKPPVQTSWDTLRKTPQLLFPLRTTSSTPTHASTNIFPSSSIHTLPSIQAILLVFINPKGPGASSIHFDLFSTAGSITSAQANAQSHLQEKLTADAIMASQRTDSVTQGAQLAKQLKEHADMEGQVGRLIHPAARTLETSVEFKAADDLCQSLECKTPCAKNKTSTPGNGGGLAW